MRSDAEFADVKRFILLVKILRRGRISPARTAGTGRLAMMNAAEMTCAIRAPTAGAVLASGDGKAMPDRRRRVLLIAEAANPDWPSVPLVGWNLSRAIAQRVDALIVTQVRNRSAFLREGLIEGEDFIAVDNETTARLFHGIGEILRGGDNKAWTLVTALSSLAYYSFERELWRKLKDRIRAGEFALVHRITPLSPTSQSLLARKLSKINVPFVIGPLNGGIAWPRGFSEVRSREGDWLSFARGLHRLLPGYRATRAKASAVIAGSRATLAELPTACSDKSFLLAENAIDPARFPFTQRPLRHDRLRVAFVGRLVPYKGADILLQAISSLEARADVDVTIVGDGPQRPELEALVRVLKLESQVRFAGWVAQEKLAMELSDCDLLALPSVREFGGGVVVEAMALGLVPLVANYGGPPELIDGASGLAIDFSDRGSLRAGFTAALEGLLADRAAISAMSREAGRRARAYFTWDAKAEQILAIYDWVWGDRSKPLFSIDSEQGLMAAKLTKSKYYEFLNNRGQNYPKVVSR